jgi:hypothetical protein
MFFSHAEATKLLMKHVQAHHTANSRREAARSEHESRLANLRSIQDLHILKARLLEANMSRVQEVIGSVNGLLAQGMDWVDIERLIDIERARGNPVAEIIVKCDFRNGKVTLGLHANEESDDEDDETEDTDEPIVEIDINLGLSAWVNAREFFDMKKAAAEKVTPFYIIAKLRNHELHNHHQRR